VNYLLQRLLFLLLTYFNILILTDLIITLFLFSSLSLRKFSITCKLWPLSVSFFRRLPPSSSLYLFYIPFLHSLTRLFTGKLWLVKPLFD